MFNKSIQKSQSPHAYDYAAAIAKAVEWLGDRYLLAKPINATPGFAAVYGRIIVAGSRRPMSQSVNWTKNRPGGR